MKNVRLFVAMDLTDAIRSAIEQFCEKLRCACPSAKWVRVEGMHVTLKFVGWIADGRLDAVRATLEGIHSPSPVRMSFHGTGFFPSEKRPRVLWIGISTSPNLADLAREMEEKFVALGVEKETREFRPHLTLARFESPKGFEHLREAIAKSGDLDFGSLRTHKFHLYQSELLHGGAKYTRLASFEFTPEKAA